MMRTLYEIITYGGRVSKFHVESFFQCCCSNLVDEFCETQINVISEQEEDGDNDKEEEKENSKAIPSLDLGATVVGMRGRELMLLCH
ncbi:hypothetical protein RFI_35788 [Reticulomyxa filosa]|uniref:Uncharacterized protein n=1 Tax=Reticulomyxa filosa TaxID=46433 RepID=X6LJU4_RETFI|nr:hypothetical protein RFI_35788 [Reticulomyxa filosa]|eukprot:ETO01651.1 hypothetical protein RFI_35788 [Reticulomyxa filosa]